MTASRVWNMHDPLKPQDLVYIGRANRRYHLAESKYANPFRIGIDGDRRTVVDLYAAYANDRFSDSEVRADLGGKSVGCWCFPLPCHGEYLVRRANKKVSNASPAL